MKNLRLLIMLFSISFVAISQEAEEEEFMYKNEIGVDIIDIIDGTLQVSYERALGKNFSFNIGSDCNQI